MEFPTPHADQYKMLREEVMTLVAETRKMEIYAATAVAVLYAWLVKDGAVVPFAAFFIAVPLVLLAGIRSYALFKRINETAEYLRLIEKAFFTEPASLPGWERHLAESRTTAVSPTAFVFWAVLLIVTLIAPFLLRP